MTNELEKIFFDTFGIEPNCKFVKYCDDCTKCGCYHYPRITSDILLELIRIISLITIKYTNEQCEICYGDGAISYLGKDLKEAILNFLISKVSIFKHQVRTLFEEGEWKQNF